MKRQDVAIGLFVLLLAGCQAQPNLNSVPVPTTDTGEVIQGTFIGRLAQQNSCLLLHQQDSDRPLLVIWPEGTTFDERSVSVPQAGSARQFRLADPVKIAGSLQTWSNVDHVASIQPYRQRCAYDLLFAVDIARP